MRKKERFMGLISISFAWLTFNCNHSAAEDSIKWTCEIYEEPAGITLGAISATPWLWVFGLFNNTGVSGRLLRFLCARANVTFSLFTAGPSLLCDGVCEWWRSYVPHPEVQEVWRAQSTFLHCRDHFCSHVPAQQCNHLQVWIREHKQHNLQMKRAYRKDKGTDQTRTFAIKEIVLSSIVESCPVLHIYHNSV